MEVDDVKLRATVRTITGKTRHIRGGKERSPDIAFVQIDGADDEFYLQYFDRDGTYITDTFHLSLEGAKSQATFEFGTLDADWQELE